MTKCQNYYDKMTKCQNQLILTNNFNSATVNLINKGSSQIFRCNVKESISDSEIFVTDLKSLKIGEHLKHYVEEAGEES